MNHSAHGAFGNLNSVRTLVLATTALAPPALAQSLLWGSQFGTSGTEEARALAPDGAGGAFVAGFTSLGLFGPALGGQDAFVARYDGAGNQLWGRQFGTSVHEGFPSALASAGAGGTFVGGGTQGSLFAPNAGIADFYVARYDGEGNLVWGRQVGTSAYDQASALAPDSAGGAFVVGYTRGSLLGAYAGSSDVFLARYDAEGNRLWGLQFGTGTQDYPAGLAPDGAGGAFVSGYTLGSLFGPNAGIYDGFLARYAGAGNLVWGLQFGTSDWDLPGGATPDGLANGGVAGDGAGGAFVSGYTRGSLFGQNAGGDDAFLARYDRDGNRVFGLQYGTSAGDSAGAIVPAADGNVLVTGWAGASLFGPLPGPYLARYDGVGNLVWGHLFGWSLTSGIALAPDGADGAYMAGWTQTNLFGPPAGEADAWLARIGEPCYPNCDGSTGVGGAPTLNVNDYICFQTRFALGDPYADCDGSGVRNVNDYICFQTRFALGCP